MDVADIIKVLENRADKAMQDAFSHWMAMSNIHREEFRQVRQLWMLTRGPWPVTTDREPLTQIHERMKRNHRRKKSRQAIFTLTVVLMISVTAWVLWPTYSPRPSGQNLSFNHASLKDVAGQLEKTFDINIEITRPEVETCLFTGSFSKASTLKDIMNAISHSLSISVAGTRRGYEWKGSGC
ncbi:MAG: DUF4974 domain-containing protein [Cyclobacteriaceae bacterium]|nr:DUF4974 domain-containing protein [Cyclobacteriaceae bacterium]